MRKFKLKQIGYNAAHIWKVSNTPLADEKSLKFAMNWLRSAILKPSFKAIKGETLYSALGNIKERRLLEIELYSY